MAFSKKELAKQKVKKVVLISYIVLSALFIISSLYTGLKVKVYNVGIQQGQELAVSQIVLEAKKECKPFNLFAGQNKVDLIDVACLQQAPVETEEIK